MNIELLERVKRHILEEPRRVNMDDWISRKGDPDYNDFVALDKEPPCGTVACIAGWAAVLTASPGETENAFHDRLFLFIAGPQHLNIGKDGEDRLFYVLGWPSELRTRLRACKPGTPAYAQVVADRIDHFIKTEGRE